MKLIIDIPDFTYEEIKKTELTEDTEGHIFHALSCIKDGTHIPENPTNGDMIKALFPRDYVKIYDRSVSSWWNAPYKRGDME